MDYLIKIQLLALFYFAKVYCFVLKHPLGFRFGVNMNALGLKMDILLLFDV